MQYIQSYFIGYQRHILSNISYYNNHTMEKLNCIEQSVCSILKRGKIPKHVGFIMDGNRRHAKKNNLGNPINGHVQGVKSLKKCLLVCRELEVKMITLYCFSIENFKRSKEEVEGLMKLFLDTFDECSTLTEYLVQQKIKVNIIGNTKLFEENIQDCIKKIEDKTKIYDKMVVNLCFGYDSLWEASQSISSIRQSNYFNFISNLKIPCFLDILVRTANEKRLSNFMLSQCSYAHICILKEHWPQINVLSFGKIILQYNYHYEKIEKQKAFIEKQLMIVNKSETKQNEEEGQNLLNDKSD